MEPFKDNCNLSEVLHVNFVKPTNQEHSITTKATSMEFSADDENAYRNIFPHLLMTSRNKKQ